MTCARVLRMGLWEKVGLCRIIVGGDQRRKVRLGAMHQKRLSESKKHINRGKEKNEKRRVYGI